MDAVLSRSLSPDLATHIAQQVHKLNVANVLHDVCRRPSLLEQVAIANKRIGKGFSGRYFVSNNIVATRILTIKYVERGVERMFVYHKCDISPSTLVVFDAEIVNGCLLLIDRLYFNGNHVQVCDLCDEDLMYLQAEVANDMWFYLNHHPEMQIAACYETHTTGWRAETFDKILTWVDTITRRN